MATDETLDTLAHAVRVRVVLKYLGQLAVVLAALTAVPLAVALWYHDYRFALRLAEVIVLLLVGGGLFTRFPAPARVQVNEALVITVLAFLLAALLMSYPLMTAGLDFLDALFEAISGITTTGLSTLAAVQDKSPAFLFSRAWMQWYGGLGIVVLTVALLMGHHMASRRLIDPESGSENLATTARYYAQRMLTVYLTLTVIGIGLVAITHIGLFNTVTQVLAAVSTGGFSTFNASLAALPLAAQLTITLVAAAGAVALPLYSTLFNRGIGDFLRDTELRTLLGMLLAVSAVLAWLLARDGMPWPHALSQGIMLGFSAQTTTGFSSLDVAHLDAGSKLVVIVAMMIGGSLGSTAGGIKILRLLVLWRLMRLTVVRTALPDHAVVEPTVGGRRLDSDDVERALMIVALFVSVVVLSWLPFVLLGYDALDALFEVVSATGTVGLSTGVSSTALPPLLKGILCFDMLAGRVEIVALLVVLYPGSWFGKRTELA